MDFTDEQHFSSNTASILEFQQQYHFMAQLATRFRHEPRQALQGGDDALNDYWGGEWSDDDDFEEEQQRQSTTWKDQKHTNGDDDRDDDDDNDYYVNWGEHLNNPSAPSTVSIKQEENDLAALQELTRLLHQTLPSASASTAPLNPLPKVIQYRYEWDEPNQCPSILD